MKTDEQTRQEVMSLTQEVRRTLAQAAEPEQSKQWQMAHTVAEMMCDIDLLDMEVRFVPCALGRPGEEQTCSIYLKTLAGSIVFLEDSSGNCWLTRWYEGRTSGLAQRLEGNEDIQDIADLCFFTLSGTRSGRRKSVGLN